MIPDAAWVGIAITSLGSMFAIVWHSGQLAARTEVRIAQLESALTTVLKMGENVALVPSLIQRMTQSEDTNARVRSYISELREEVAALKAVTRRSYHDEAS